MMLTQCFSFPLLFPLQSRREAIAQAGAAAVALATPGKREVLSFSPCKLRSTFEY